MKESKSQTLITGVYRTGTEYITQLINRNPNVIATMYRVRVGENDKFGNSSMKPLNPNDVRKG